MKALIEITESQSLTENLRLAIKEVQAPTPVDKLATVMNLLEAEAKELKKQEAQIAAIRKTIELLQAQAETKIAEEMKENGLTEVAGQFVKYTFKKNPHKLIIEDESKIPNYFFEEVVVKQLRKDAIKDELKIGTEIAGCKLVQTESIQLKTV